MFEKFFSLFRRKVNEKEIVPFESKTAEEYRKEENAMPEYEGDGKVCPLCESTDTRTISYGMIRFTSDEAREKFQKTSISGGCGTDDNSPKFYCCGCKRRFGKDDWGMTT